MFELRDIEMTHLLISDFFLASRAIKYDVRPIENTNDEDAMKLDAKIRSQNDEYFKIYDYIVANVRKDDQIRILEANGQLPLLSLQDTQVNGSVVNIVGNHMSI